MSAPISVILFDAAVEYANATADVSIRDDLRMAFVAGADWQWKRVEAVDAEIAQLREELAATYEELIEHNGDSLDDTRAKRVASLREPFL